MSSEDKIEKVDGYRTSNGDIYDDFGDAHVHQQVIDRTEAVRHWVMEYCWNGMGQSEMAELILEYRESLAEAIKDNQ